MASELKLCGGCGASSERERCIWCLHDFGTTESAWVRTELSPGAIAIGKIFHGDEGELDELTQTQRRTLNIAAALAAEAELATRPAPAATDTGLETIGFVPPMFVEGKGADYNDIFRSVSIAENYTAVVTRSHAEELLAAERAKYRDAMEKLVESQRETLVWQQRAIDLKADNAAQAARIKELETERTMIVSHATMGQTDGIGLTVNDISVRVSALRNELYEEGEKRAEALGARIKELEEYAREATKAITGLTGGGSENFSKEIGDVFTADLPYCLERIRERYVSKVELKRLEAKLAAAEKALEPFADIADLIDAETEGMAETDELVLHFHDYEFAKWPVSFFRKARAVLGGKAS